MKTLLIMLLVLSTTAMADGDIYVDGRSAEERYYNPRPTIVSEEYYNLQFNDPTGEYIEYNPDIIIRKEYITLPRLPPPTVIYQRYYSW